LIIPDENVFQPRLAIKVTFKDLRKVVATNNNSHQQQITLFSKSMKQVILDMTHPKEGGSEGEQEIMITVVTAQVEPKEVISESDDADGDENASLKGFFHKYLFCQNRAARY
jgi:hypothetical protein